MRVDRMLRKPRTALAHAKTRSRAKNALVEQLRRAVRGYAVRIADAELRLPVIDLDPFGEVWVDVDDGDVSVT